LGATARFKEVWTVKANAQVGFSGSTYMEDYDWLEPFAQAGAPDDQWSDRSRHSNTDLDRYINLDVAVGRDFAVNDTTLVNLHGGFKYTNVKRTSYGGDFVYSTNGFRDDVGNLPDGEKGITYEQRYPGLFVGGEASTRFGAWTHRFGAWRRHHQCQRHRPSLDEEQSLRGGVFRHSFRFRGRSA
jgi:outer membrane protease